MKLLNIVDIGRFLIYFILLKKSGLDWKLLVSKDIIYSYKDNRVFREWNCGVFFNFICLIIVLFFLGIFLLIKFVVIWLIYNKRVVSCFFECKNFYNFIKFLFEKVMWWENLLEFLGVFWFLICCVYFNMFFYLFGKWIK